MVLGFLTILGSATFSLTAQTPSRTTTVVRGQIVPIPQAQVSPCNDREVQVNYDKQSPSYHHYAVETELCSMSNIRCNRQSVFSKMTSQVRFITPTENSAPVTDCMIVDVNIPGPWGKDSVRVSVDRQNLSVTNYTRKDHALSPGKVTRTLVAKNGSIYVVTDGEGTGSFRPLNVSLAQRVWQPVDRALRESVK
jgi:hypothetical protein